MDYADQLTNEIKFKTFLIELAKNEEFADIFIDFSCREGFVDLFDVANETKYKNYTVAGENIRMGANELKAIFKMLDRQCPGLIEFKKKGWNGLLGYPKIKITAYGKDVAAMLMEAKKNRNQTN